MQEAGARDWMTRIVDTGSGYNAQHDLPVHVGLRSTGPVAIVVRAPGVGDGNAMPALSVDPAEWRGRILRVRVGGSGGGR